MLASDVSDYFSWSEFYVLHYYFTEMIDSRRFAEANMSL